jgi:hypothetical protein
MKVKANIKFDLNETIRRLNAIAEGYKASAQRLENIVAEAQVKKDEAHQKYMGEPIIK